MKRFFFRLNIFLTVLLLISDGGLLLRQLDGQDWPRFRGPNGTGISEKVKLPIKWSEDDFDWSTELPGEGHGSPVVVGKRLFLLCGNQFTADRHIVCLHADSGEIVWNKKYSSAPHYLHRDNNYASSTPVADKDGVVTCWTTPKKFVLTALDNDGNQKWQRDFGEYKSAWGGAASPIIVDDKVIILNDQMNPKIMARFLPEGTKITEPGKSFAIAVDRHTGKTLWMIPRKTVIAGYATPCVRTLANEKKEIVFFGTGNGMTGVDVETGKVNWELPRAMPSRTVMSPVIAGDLVIGSYGSGLVGDRLVAVQLPGKDNKANIKFHLKQSIPLVPTSLFVNELLFLTCETGVISCVDIKTQKEVWKQRHRGKFYASPVCADGKIYSVDRRGNVLVFAAEKEFKKLSVNSLGDDCFATPAIANGRIYFRTATQLIAVGN